jgi:hypothetical protein
MDRESIKAHEVMVRVVKAEHVCPALDEVKGIEEEMGPAETKTDAGRSELEEKAGTRGDSQAGT